MYVCIYICHTLIVWAQFLWSRPQTTSHVVLARPCMRRSKDRARARAEMEQGPHGTGPTRRRSTCEKDRARAEMEQEQSKLQSEDGNEGTLHQKRVRQRRTSLTDTQMTLRLLSETLQTTTLPSSPLYLVPST